MVSLVIPGGREVRFSEEIGYGSFVKLWDSNCHTLVFSHGLVDRVAMCGRVSKFLS